MRSSSGSCSGKRSGWTGRSWRSPRRSSATLRRRPIQPEVPAASQSGYLGIDDCPCDACVVVGMIGSGETVLSLALLESRGARVASRGGQVKNSIARVVVALGVVACSKDGGTGVSSRPTTSSTASSASSGTSATPPSKPRVVPDAGPCASDADCTIWMDPCSCGCNAIAGKPPADDTGWATMCNGAPPRNCGAAYPCMNMKAACDPSTKSCRATK